MKDPKQCNSNTQKCLYVLLGLRKHDVCFLITVRPTKPYGTKFDRRRPFIEQVGLVYVRGCEIQGMLDDKGRVIEDGMVIYCIWENMCLEWSISVLAFLVNKILDVLFSKHERFVCEVLTSQLYSRSCLWWWGTSMCYGMP